jgi:hypothetical protein
MSPRGCDIIRETLPRPIRGVPEPEPRPLIPLNRFSPLSPPSPLRGIAIGLAAAACLGMSCGQDPDPPSLPSPRLSDIRLILADPERGAAGAYLAWHYPAEQATYFLVYQRVGNDTLADSSLPAPVATESLHLELPLPDSTRPFTAYFSVRAVKVEATGQKVVSDSLIADSLSVTPALSILSPSPGALQQGRMLDLQVQTQSDPGVALRLAYLEKTGGSWRMKIDTCMPMDACGIPVFGRSVQRETLVLDLHEGSDPLPALFCVFGTESFQGQRTGLSQSMGCSRFQRIAP